jgi:transcriptional regulator with XRE-family HTH domain
MTKKELKAVRAAMGLTQAEFAKRLKIARNSVARMESGGMIITPPMGLLISFVAREAGVDATHSQRSRSKATDKRKDASKVRSSIRPHGRKDSLSR